jgi:enamine deaminase RidA (YjgF/YER057c/UK114 family)
MIHTRIRTFNAKNTCPEQKLDNDLCQAVIARGTICLCGQCSRDLYTSVSVAVGDPAGQAEQVMRNVDQLPREWPRQHVGANAAVATDQRFFGGR